LDAIEHNVRVLVKAAAPAMIMAVVKADGYGHGAVPVAKSAIGAGARWLGVYTVAEGVRLRQAGLTCRILVLGPFTPSEVDSIGEHGLTPNIVSARSALALARKSTPTVQHYHLEVDTGLTRAGVPWQEAASLASALQGHKGLCLEGIFTHFASADEDLDFTTLQLTRFRQVVHQLGRLDVHPPVVHACNSAGTITMPRAHFDMVRTGIAVYGIPPVVDSRTLDLQPALNLTSEVVRVVTIGVGTSVGYGREYRSLKETQIASVPIGYGDGYQRALGLGKGRAIVRDVEVPVVGRVSMDQVTLDVGSVQGVSVGDAVTFIGRQGPTSQSAADVAAQAGTIPYEIVSSLQPRVPRVYTRNGRAVAVAEYGVLRPLELGSSDALVSV